MKPNKTPRKHAAFASSSRQMKRRPKVKSLLAVLVAFCTVCALTMPAATLEGQAQASCGLAEHTHDESCYESVLVCGQEEGEGHVHDESCYEEVLTCEIPEHTHSEACWAQPETQAEAGNEENSEAVTGDGAGSDMEAAAGTETGTDTEADTGTGIGTDSSENGDAAEAGSETDSSGNAGTGAGDTGSAEAGAESGDGQTENDGAGSEADGTGENGSGTETAGDQGESTSTEDALTEADKTEQAENPQAAEEAAEMPDGATVPEGYTEQYTVRDEENGFAVTVYAPKGVVPEGAVLSAELLSEETEEYAAAEQELAAETEAMMAENGVSALSEDGADAASEDGEAAAPSYGFAALDIHFEYENGEEVEPNGDVYVVIDAAGLLPEDADPESVTVQHHAEQEDGSVAVETVADTADATNGVVAVVENADEAEAKADVQAAFEVDGFSTFTITWGSGGTTYFRVTVHYVDEATGEEIEEISHRNVTIENVTDNNEQTYSFRDYAVENDNYTFTGEILYSQNGDFAGGQDVTHMTASQETESSSWPWERTTTRYLTFYNNTIEIAQLSREGSQGRTQTANIYLVYRENTTVPQTGFYIEDTVMENGNFTVQYNGDEEINLDGYTYEWSRVLPDVGNEDDDVNHPADSAGWQDVIRTRVSGSMYNLSENGQSLNVSLDAELAGIEDDDRLWYKVEVYDANEALVVTLYKRVPYYVELQNGSFETPVRSIGQHNVDLDVDDEGVIWKTTDTNNEIEIIRPYGVKTGGGWFESEYTGTYGTHGVNEAPDPEPENGQNRGQIAELNADSEGTLYQDVLTIPGSTVNWQLQHRARNNAAEGFYSGYDTMYVVIMSADKANRVTSQSQVREIIRAAGFTPTEYISDTGKVEHEITSGKYAGAVVWRITDFIEGESADPGADSWTRYMDSYTVPDGQYMTRFFFAAGATGFDNKNPNSHLAYTVGNLLDDVAFTTDILDPDPGTATVQVTKTVNGLTDEELQSYEVSFDIKGSDGTVINTITIDSFGAPDADGNSTASGACTVNLGTADGMSVTVTENLPDMGIDYNVATISSSGSSTGDQSISVMLRDQNATDILFTNTYTQTTGSLTINKVVTDVNADAVASQTYTFTVTAGDDVTGDLPTEFTGKTATVTVIGATNVTLTGLPAGTYTVVEQGNSQEDIIVDGEKYQFDGVTYIGGTGTDSNEVIVSAGGTAEITATNSYRQVVDIVIEKVDGEGNELAGAEFQLTNADDKYYDYDPATGTSWNDVATTFDADVEGDNLFTLHDLPNGTYTLTETKAPDGYQLLTSNITITVNEGTVIASGAGAKYENGTITVTNITGTELPETGGPGTTILTIGGLLLMAGAVGGGYGLRRRRGKEGR